MLTKDITHSQICIHRREYRQVVVNNVSFPLATILLWQPFVSFKAVIGTFGGLSEGEALKYVLIVYCETDAAQSCITFSPPRLMQVY